MRLDRRIILQLTIFAIVAAVSATALLLGYVDAPARLFGLGHYRVSVQLPESAGLYKNGNVTFRGTEVGRIDDAHLTPTGVVAVLDLNSQYKIPSNVDAQVHSVSAVGEQYIALQPRGRASSYLQNGDTITVEHTSVPVPIDRLLDTTNRGIEAIPRRDLKTAVDEASTAVGGLGPELTRIINGSIALANGAHDNQQALTSLIDQASPVLDTQSETADSVTRWAANLASITGQLRDSDRAVTGVINNGGSAAAQGQSLLARLQLSLPILLANLVSIDKVAITFAPNIEQILVLLPQGVAQAQSAIIPGLDTPGPYRAAGNLTFALNLNLPPPCTTGYLPAQQRTTPSVEQTQDRPAGDLYCRVPQDSPFNVRGARNIPCETKPGKRAPTVKMCESDEHYVPLNDGYNWKGDPNATLSGQGVPQLPPAGTDGLTRAAPQTVVPPISVAEYNPATGSYVAPDGRLYTQSDLLDDAAPKTWQSMLVPSEH